MRLFATALFVFLASPFGQAQDDVSGAWRAVLPSGETLTVDLLAGEDQLEGSVRFENGRIEEITEGTVDRVVVPGREQWRVRFVTPGLFNGEDVILLWDGEAGVGPIEDITIWTTIQLLDGREIELYAPRRYVRLDN